jgi:hypothetical protein
MIRRSLLLGLLALAPLQASATISRAMPFDDKVDNASAIVIG